MVHDVLQVERLALNSRQCLIRVNGSVIYAIMYVYMYKTGKRTNGSKLINFSIPQYCILEAKKRTLFDIVSFARRFRLSVLYSIRPCFRSFLCPSFRPCVRPTFRPFVCSSICAPVHSSWVFCNKFVCVIVVDPKILVDCTSPPFRCQVGMWNGIKGGWVFATTRSSSARQHDCIILLYVVRGNLMKCITYFWVGEWVTEWQSEWLSGWLGEWISVTQSTKPRITATK